ncbi:MAG: YfhO family protein [Deltaproteobacteria bacterium]|nr:YfhO family protein [Deltaproteobacteria bacterium]
MNTKIRSIKTGGFACIVTAVGLNLLFFYPVLFLGKVFFFRDIHRWFYPMKAYLAASLKSWEIPFWCPHYFCGSPFMSDIQSGVFYPISLLFLLFPFPLSFNIYVVFHFFLGFCFFFLFIQGMGLSKKAALLTSISYAFGSYTIATVNTLNNLSTAIWLPAVLWAFQMGCREKRAGYFLTILFLCMSILGGEPQLFILTAGLLFLHAIFLDPKIRDAAMGRSGAACLTALWARPIRERWLKGIFVIAVVVAAILLTLVQLGPTYLDYTHSARIGGLSYEEASRFSLSPAMLKHLILPLHFSPNFLADPATLRDFFPGTGDMPWLLTLYPGMIIAPLAFVALFFCPLRKTLFWTLTFAMSVLLALGSHLPLHRLFYECLPFFRFPEKFVFLSSFSLLVLAACGFDRVTQAIGSGNRKGRLLFLALSGILICDLYLNHENLNPVCDRNFYQYHHPGLDPLVRDPGRFRIYEAPMPNPPELANTVRNHHVKWQMMLHPNLGILFGLDHVGGVPALELRFQHQITELLSRPWHERIRFLRLANVKYIIASESLDSKPELRGQVERVNGLVFRVKNELPRAWLVNRLDPLKTFTVQDLIAEGFDPAHSALAKREMTWQCQTSQKGPPVTVRYKPNAVLIHTKADAPSVLVLSETAYPGWTVTVDGTPRECLWLDLLFQGVQLEPGSHEVVFRYRPKHFFLFAGISTFCLFVYVIAWTVCLWRRKDGPLSGKRGLS